MDEIQTKLTMPKIKVLPPEASVAESWQPPKGWSATFSLDRPVASIQDLIDVIEQIEEQDLFWRSQYRTQQNSADSRTDCGLEVVRDVWCLLRQVAHKHSWGDLPNPPAPDAREREPSFPRPQLLFGTAQQALSMLDQYLKCKQPHPLPDRTIKVSDAAKFMGCDVETLRDELKRQGVNIRKTGNADTCRLADIFTAIPISPKWETRRKNLQRYIK
jgi:hypothetical protein